MYPDAGKSFVAARARTRRRRFALVRLLRSTRSCPRSSVRAPARPSTSRSRTPRAATRHHLAAGSQGLVRRHEDRDLDRWRSTRSACCQAQPARWGTSASPRPARPCATWSASASHQTAACSRSYLRHRACSPRRTIVLGTSATPCASFEGDYAGMQAGLPVHTRERLHPVVSGAPASPTARLARPGGLGAGQHSASQHKRKEHETARPAHRVCSTSAPCASARPFEAGARPKGTAATWRS